MAPAMYLSSGKKEIKEGQNLSYKILTIHILLNTYKHSFAKIFISFFLDKMLYCKDCKGYKGKLIKNLKEIIISTTLAPRSEHCSKCGRCILKMCHHCSVLNVCIGHYNQVRAWGVWTTILITASFHQKNFIFLLLSVLTASLQSLATNIFGVKRYLNTRYISQKKNHL